MLWFKLAYCAFLMVTICFACMDYNFSMKNEKYRMKVIGVLLLVVFSMIVALRPLEVKDTCNYIDCFNNSAKYLSEIDNINLLRKYHGYESGYLIINAAFSKILPDYRCFFFLIALFSSFFSIKNIEEIRQNEFKDSEDYWFVTMAIYVTGYALDYLGVAIRAGFAITFALISYKYFSKKKYLVSVIFLFIGFLIQRSVLCVLCLMIIGAIGLKIRKTCFLGIYISLLIMLFLNVGSLVYPYIAEPALNFMQRIGVNGYSGYLLTGIDQAVGLTDIWVCMTGLIICFLGVKRGKKYFDTLYFSFLIVAVIIVFLHGARAIARLYETFLFFSIPIYTEEIYILKRKLGAWVLVALLFGNFLVSMKTVFG